MKKPPPPRVDADRVVLHPFTYLRRVDGVWYRIELANIPETAWHTAYDAVLKRWLFHADRGQLRIEHGRYGVYAVSKRQLSKRELKRLRMTHLARDMRS